MPQTLRVAAAIVAASLSSAIALLAAGCTGPDDTAPRPARVLLISIDTLRADFLGCYDDAVNWTPRLDAFAAESLVFTDAMAQAPTTTPSHKSILYSLYPHVHQTFAWSMPEEHVDSPIDTLRRHGLRTAAFVGGGHISRMHGFDRGFDDFWQNDHYGDRAEKRHIVPLERDLSAWLDDHHADPFFLFVHTYQTHCPYVPPTSFREDHAGWYQGQLDARDSCGGDFERLDLTDEDARYVRSLYAAEVAYVDAFLGRLFDRMRELGIYDDTMIVFLSDHGEALGEAGQYGHGYFSEWELRVPLIAKIPGVPAARVDAPIESLDVMPTIYAVFGIEPPFEFQGRNLLAAIDESPAQGDRLRIAEKRAFAAIDRGPWRLVHNLQGRREKGGLYHVETDPDCVSDRAAENPNIAAALLEDYHAIRGSGLSLAENFVLDGDDRPMLDAATRRQLEILGYIR